MAMSDEMIAKVVHAAMAEYCRGLGQTFATWDQVSDQARDNALEGVRAQRHSGGDARPVAECHDAWVASLLEQGWTRGSALDVEAKTHPFLMPFDELPTSERRKAYLWRAVVDACVEPTI